MAFLSISIKLVHEDERAAARIIIQQAQSLNQFATDFSTALALFDKFHPQDLHLTQAMLQFATTGVGDFPSLVAERTMLRSWKMIAARDGARCLYLIEQAFDGLAELIPRSPTLNKLVIHKIKRTARSDFKKAFPHFEAVRHAGAHTMELVNNPEKLAEHAITTELQSAPFTIGAGSQLYVSESLNDRTYQTTFAKKMASYDLSDDSLAIIKSVVSSYFTAFQPAEEASARIKISELPG